MRIGWRAGVRGGGAMNLNFIRSRSSVAITAALLLAGGLGSRTQGRACEQILKQGQFHSVAHYGSGTAMLCRGSGDNLILVFANLKTAFRPDLQVYLTDAPDADDNDTVVNSRRLLVGSLGQGSSWSIPASQDEGADGFRSVVIWSARYGVNFATAPLRLSR